MLSYEESLKLIKDTKALLEGHFILWWGLHSSQYAQCAKLLSVPKAAKLICESLAEKIKNKYKDIDMILSPAIGGIVVGYEVGRQLDVRTIFAERENKKLILRRGFSIPKKANVLIVEDVITTGKSALECEKLVRENEGKLVGFACIIDRSDETKLIKDNIISQIKFKIETFNEKNLPDKLKNIKAEKPGTRNLKNE